MNTNTRKTKKVIKYLQSSESRILNYLKKIVGSKDFDYRTFGTAIEEHLTDAIAKILTEGGFIKSSKDYIVAPHKNYFPDFELKTSPPLAIEYKSGNKSQYRDSRWITIKNSENDMGTISEWPKRINKFGEENIYYIFVIYNFNDREKEILNIEIAPFYQFLGINKDGLLKYREKDGNLRPKDFDAKPPVKTSKRFKQLLKKTRIYRSRRIIRKHKLIIKKASEDF